MSEMKELYERVASDPSLQKRFIEIMEGAQPSEKEAIGQKLIDFARDAGFDGFRIRGRCLNIRFYSGAL